MSIKNNSVNNPILKVSFPCSDIQVSTKMSLDMKGPIMSLGKVIENQL